jgi:photosystem II stability/assembly factor-like uncharacterized protein
VHIDSKHVFPFAKVNANTYYGDTGVNENTRFFISYDNCQTWNALERDEKITSVIFLSDKVGFYASNNGLFRSADGAKSWTKINSETNFGCLAFCDEQHGIAVLDSNYLVPVGNGDDVQMRKEVVYRTLDGGFNWQRLSLNVSDEANDIISARRGLMYVVSDQKIKVSNDYGATWRVDQDACGGFMIFNGNLGLVFDVNSSIWKKN